jgi:hypothetical protein
MPVCMQKVTIAVCSIQCYVAQQPHLHLWHVSLLPVEHVSNMQLWVLLAGGDALGVELCSSSGTAAAGTASELSCKLRQQRGDAIERE